MTAREKGEEGKGKGDGRGRREGGRREGERGITDREGQLRSRPAGDRAVGWRKYGFVGRGCVSVRDIL